MVGRRVEIVGGKGFGEVRFIRAVSGNTLTLDRPWKIKKTPDTLSTYQIRTDDAIVGVMSGFFEDDDAVPPVFTFTDAAGGFPTVGQGLTGAILEIVNGPGAGQQRLILSNTATVLSLNGPWLNSPVIDESIYRINRYSNLAIPSVLVEIRDNDAAGLIVEQSQATTAVIEGGSGDQPGETDTVQIKLTRPPTDPVTVNFNHDATQLSLGASLSFNGTTWDTFQPLSVAAFNDLLREGAHTSLLRFGVSSDDGNLDVEDTVEEFTIEQ